MVKGVESLCIFIMRYKLEELQACTCPAAYGH